MANKQTLPTLKEPESGFINSNAMGNVTAVKDWKEKKWASVANLSNGIVGVSTAYKNMKHTEMLAKLDNLQQQNLHNLGDAKDPCELPDLINNANKSYDDLFKDDPYGKSFYESEAYNKFKIKNEQLTQNKVNELNHKFSSIQAVATGNEISSDIALMGDPERMSKALKSYEAMLSQMEIPTDEKFRIMGAVVKDSFGKVLTNNPNNAVNWYNYSNGAYDKYGVDGADIKNKADRYNEQKLNEQWQNYQKSKILEKDNNDAIIDGLYNQLILNPGKGAEIQQLADNTNAYVSLGFKDKAEKRFGKPNPRDELVEGFQNAIMNGTEEKFIEENWSKIVTSEKGRAIYNFLGTDENNKDEIDWDIIAEYNKEKIKDGFDLDEFVASRELQGKTLARVDTKHKEYMEKGGNKEVAEKYSANLEKRVARGENININAEVSNVEGLDTANKNKTPIYKRLEEISKNQKNNVTDEQKNVSQQNYNALLDEVLASQSFDDLNKVLSKPIYLTTNDTEKFINKVYEKRDRLSKENKASEKEQKELTQKINAFKIMSSGAYYTTESITEAVENEAITPEQGTAQINLQNSRREKELKAITEENKKIRDENAKNFFITAYKNSEKGILTEPADFLTREEVSLLQTLNDKTNKNNYESTIANFVIDSARMSLTPKGYEKYVQDVIRYSPTPLSVGEAQNVLEQAREKVANENAKKLSEYVSQIPIFYKPLGKDFTKIEQIAKQQMVSDIAYRINENKDVNVEEIVKKYKPTRDMLREEQYFYTDAETSLNGVRDSLFVDIKQERGDKEEYVKILADDVSFSSYYQYQLAVTDAYKRGVITPEKYGSYMSPLLATKKEMIDRLVDISNSGNVIEQSAGLLKEKFYGTKGVITNYDKFYKDLISFASYLEAKGVSIEAEETIFGTSYKGTNENVNTIRGLFDDWFRTNYSNTKGRII